MKKIRNLVINIIGSILIITTLSWANNPVIITDGFTTINLSDHIEYYEDASNELSINDFLYSDKYKFRPIGTYKNLGYSRSSYWIRFQFTDKRTHPSEPHVALLLNAKGLNYVDFYLLNGEGHCVDSSFTGSSRPASLKPRPEENISFIFTPQPDKKQTIYLQIKSNDPIILDFSLMEIDEFFKLSRTSTLIIGLFIGIFSLAIVYYLSLYIRLKDLSFLYLAIAGLALLFDHIATNQVAFIYLWPNQIYWNDIAVPFFDALMLAFFIIFVREFLELKKYLYQWNRILIFVVLIYILYMLLLLFSDPFIISQLIDSTISITLILILIVSYISLKNGYKPAKYFFIGIVLISITGIYHIICKLGLLPINEIARYGYLVAAISLIVFFTQAVSERIKLIESEKEKAEHDLFESKEQLSLVIKGADLGTWDLNVVTGEMICNERLYEILGLEFNEVNASIYIWKTLLHPDEKEDVLTRIYSYLKKDAPSFAFEYRLKHKTGRWIWVATQGKILDFDDKGKALRAAGTIMDISNHKYAEIAQKIIYNITNAVLTTKDMHEFYELIHKQLSQLIDTKNFQVGLYNKDQNTILLPYSVDEYDNYKQIPAEKTCSAYVLKKRKPVLLRQSDIEQLIMDGEIKIYGTPSKIWLGVPLKIDDKIIGLIFIQNYDNENAYNERDLDLLEIISEQIAISIARKQSEQQLNILTRSVEQSPASIVITDVNGNIEYVNPKFTEITGYSFEEVRGGNPRILKSGKVSEELYEELWDTIKSGKEWKGEFCNKKKNGEIYWELAYIAPIMNEHEKITHYLAVKEDITDRKHAQEELNKARNYINNIINSMPSVVIGVNEDCTVTHWNEEAENVTQVQKDDAIGKPIEEIFPRMEEELDKIRKSIYSKQIIKESKIKDVNENKPGYSDITIYPLITNGVEGAVIRVDDVTERVRLEEMMVQSEKMISVGGLAAGMAHEINNPLAGIMQNTQVILNRLTTKMKANEEAARECNTTFETIQAFMEKRKIIEMLKAIHDTGTRASKIVENMLSFSRKSDTTSSAYDIAKILDDTVELAASDYDLKRKYDFRQIKIIREYAPDVSKVYCERSKIQQVFLNILRNGAQAIIDRTQERNDKEPCFIFRVKQENEMVLIEIEDNGPGMSEETRIRAFEPFFTTKDVNAGTGLGLSVSYFIITEQHKGKMFIETKKGKGTSVLLLLPIR